MRYLIDFKRFNEHLVNVQLDFIAQSDEPVLWLPTWIAGSYLIREFSKQITRVDFLIDNHAFPAQKISKNEFLLPNIKQGQNVQVVYEVYCRDLSVRTAFVDGTRLFANFTSLLFMVKNQEQALAEIALQIPQAFLDKNPNAVIATGLKFVQKDNDIGREIVFSPITAFECYDYPFEISEQASFGFEIVHPDSKSKIAHRFFIAGRHQANLTRLATDVRQICQTYVNWLGDTPFADYTFMTMAVGNDYGGLEHINSTALITPRDDLPTAFEPDLPSDNYQRFLGLCSHEYFHAWWVKSVRPDVMMNADLQNEAYTPLLWVFEGFTSYVDDFMLMASGIIGKLEYLQLLFVQINRYFKTDGRLYQSVADSSFDAWIKLYRHDENTANQGISYYNKGALVACCLDLLLLKNSNGKYRLFDMIKVFYEKSRHTPDKRYAFTTNELASVVDEMVGAGVWQSFYDNYVIGTTALPIVDLLEEFGIRFAHQQQDVPWGMTFDEVAGGLKITYIKRDSAASRAGLSVGDVVLAMDGIKASKKRLDIIISQQRYTQNTVKVHAFRRDELMDFQVDSTPCGHELYSFTNNKYDKTLGLLMDNPEVQWLTVF